MPQSRTFADFPPQAIDSVIEFQTPHCAAKKREVEMPFFSVYSQGLK